MFSMPKVQISNIKSRDVGDILGTPPTRKLHILGYSLYLVIFIVFLSTNFIPYSTVISGKIEIINYANIFLKGQNAEKNIYPIDRIKNFEEINKLYRCKIVSNSVIKVDSLAGPMKIHKTGNLLYVIENESHLPIEGKALFKESKNIIKEGTPVKIVLDDYSEKEIGYIAGVVERNDFDNKEVQELTVSFPNGMHTNKNVRIDTGKKLSGKAYIRLSVGSLLEKILNKLTLTGKR